MALKYFGDEIKKVELVTKRPYIGYISPKGILVDYNNSIKESYGGHVAWGNPLAAFFINFFSFVIKKTNINDLQSLLEEHPHIFEGNILENTGEIIQRGIRFKFDGSGINDFSYDSFLQYLDEFSHDILSSINHSNEYDVFKKDLIVFFKNAYQNKDFFKAIDRKVEIINKVDFEKLIGEVDLDNEKYEKYVKNFLMQHFKDICVMMIGYDSIERFKPNGRLVKPCDDCGEIEPRIITTSHLNINERFYNYLLMDWKIFRVSRYSFNAKTGIYEKESSLISNYQTDKEKILHDEITAIKKFVPNNDRRKFFK